VRCSPTPIFLSAASSRFTFPSFLARLNAISGFSGCNLSYTISAALPEAISSRTPLIASTAFLVPFLTVSATPLSSLITLSI